MRATLELLYASAAAGAAMVFEHPEEPADQNLVSAWRLEEMRFAFEHLGVQRVHIQQ